MTIPENLVDAINALTQAVKRYLEGSATDVRAIIDEGGRNVRLTRADGRPVAKIWYRLARDAGMNDIVVNSEQFIAGDRFHLLRVPEGEYSLEATAVAANDDGEPDWGSQQQSVAPIDITTPPVQLTQDEPDQLVQGEPLRIRLNDLNKAGRILKEGTGSEVLVLEGADIAQLDPRSAESGVYIKNYAKVVIRRSRIRAHRNPSKHHQNWGCCALRLHKVREVVIEDCWLDGGHKCALFDDCDSVQFRRSTCSGHRRHAWLFLRCQQDDSLPQTVVEEILIDNPKSYTSQFRESQDQFNLYECRGTQSKPMLTRKVWHRGHASLGPNGSGFVLGDGGDVGDGKTGKPSQYQEAEDIALQRTMNKFYALTGGRGLRARRIYGCVERADGSTKHGLAAYIADFSDPPGDGTNTKDTAFGDFEITDNELYYERPDGTVMGLENWAESGLFSNGHQLFEKHIGVNKTIRLQRNKIDDRSSGQRTTHARVEAMGREFTKNCAIFA